ncbi:MAG: aminotransferase class V-fold PLP-dependent enzyme [Dehalococcoidia bacterium]|nr:aminotransferase class V-fold PLP-dependent enzyme [Dehalococcoidia bacterium]
MLAPPEVDSIRAEIPATASLTYLNTGWQGPCPRSVIAAVQETFAMESAGPTAPPANQERLDIFRAARRAMAGLINATPQEITLQQNTTEGINIVVSGLGLKPGDEVITCSLEHPSVVVPIYYSRERYGAKAKIVPLTAGDSDAEIISRFENAITPATRLVILSHVTYGSGQLLPIAAISRLAHERGGYVLLDAAQSVGQMPVDVRELGCDFCAFPGHKWLLGPAATGALYVRRDLIERLEAPKVAHHAAHFYNFAGRFEPKSDTVDKFELTTVSVPLLAGLLAAVEFIEGIGVDAVRERAVHLGRYATRRLARVPDLRLVSPTNEETVAAGLVSFSLPNVPAGIVTACLWERGRIVARTVPDAACTRLSLHVFNTEAEVDAAVAIMEELARSGPPPGEFPSSSLELQTMVEL